MLHVICRWAYLAGTVLDLVLSRESVLLGSALLAVNAVAAARVSTTMPSLCWFPAGLIWAGVLGYWACFPAAAR